MIDYLKPRYFPYLIVIFLAVFVFVAQLRGFLQIPSFVLIGDLRLNLYGLILALAILLVARLIETYGSEDIKSHLWDGIIWVLLPGLVCARLWHVATDFYLYQDNLWEAMAIWHGGLSIFGAMLGFVFGIVGYSRYSGLWVWDILDTLAIFLPIGHAFGRLANFFNQELFGPPTSLPWGMYVRVENRPQEFVDHIFFHPIFLYEAIGNILIFCLLFFIFRYKKAEVGRGIFVALYIMMYGVLRFCLNFLRLDIESVFWTSTFASLILVLLGGIILLWSKISKQV